MQTAIHENGFSWRPIGPLSLVVWFASLRLIAVDGFHDSSGTIDWSDGGTTRALLLAALLLSPRISGEARSARAEWPLSVYRTEVAQAPEMGWNLWNTFRTDVDQAKLRAVAGAIADSGSRSAAITSIDVAVPSARSVELVAMASGGMARALLIVWGDAKFPLPGRASRDITKRKFD